MLDLAWQFLSTLLKDFGVIDFPYVKGKELSKLIDQSDPLTIRWRFICCGIGSVLIIPFAFQRSLGTMRYFSILIVACILYTIAVGIV